jgi:hypothetical protein
MKTKLLKRLRKQAQERVYIMRKGGPWFAIAYKDSTGNYYYAQWCEYFFCAISKSDMYRSPKKANKVLPEARRVYIMMEIRQMKRQRDKKLFKRMKDGR